MASVNYSVGSNWGSGFVGNMAVPGDTNGLHGWVIEFDATFDISSVWGAEIVSHVGNHYVIRNAAWNADVPAGGQASFGFQATPGSAGTSASGFVVNGAGTPPPPVLPTLSIDDAAISEGNSGTAQLTFTVKLSQAATGPVTVQYSTADGTAASGADYTARTGTLTFAAGETSKTITIPVLGDTAVEANEAFTVALSGASGATIADGSATGTIANDDVAPPPPPPTGGNSLGYAIASNWGSGFTATMTVGSGSAGLHGWTVEFNSTATITSIWSAEIVSHVGDHYVVRNVAWNGDVGGGKTTAFGFQATPGSGGAAASGFAINGTAVGQDPVPTPPGLSVADATVVEGSSGSHDLAFTVTLSAAATSPVTVAYATANGTATAGSDYAALAGTLTFAAGETSKVVHVKVSGDTAVEANEALTLNLSSANGATIVRGSATGTITNDDTVPPPTLAIGDATFAEGSAAAPGHGTFTVTLSAASATPVTVNYATANGTATAGSDYVAQSGTLTFAAGETQKTVQVTAIGDAVVEANEGFTVVLTNPAGATLADGTGAGTITNDDAAPPPPTLAIGDSTFAEGSAASPGHASFTVTLSAASATPVTVSYATANGTAAAGSDYVAQFGTLTFAAGETQKIIQVTAIGDAVVEANEGFTVVLTNPSGATLADATGAGTITNDDAAPSVELPALSISDVTVTEGDPGTATGPVAAGWLSTSGNQIVDSAGHSVQIAGVNWFGFENTDLAPHGLWTRGYQSMMDQMVDLGFNTIRLPFSNDTIHSTGTPNINYAQNPDLQGLSAMQVMDKIVAYAGQIGMKIILDHHRNDSGAGTSPNGLWCDGQHSEVQWIADWQMLAQRYADNSTVIGADLHNEPHAGVWGGGGPNDWAAAAERAGDAIGAVNPNMLIFVEGVANYQGQNYWWGGNLMGVRDRPIDLAVDNKLVYSAHDYPNSVWAQPWFQGDNFAAGLPAKFDQMWGYIFKEGIAPVYIGEFGTNLTDPKDAPWLEAITSYLSGDLDNNGTHDLAAGKQGVSWTFWSWNPNSGDTGGILGNDWRSVNENKMAYLTPIQFDFGSDAGGGTGGSTNAAVFVLTLSKPATEAVTVDYHTVAGDAGAADFTGGSGSVTFAVGEQTKTISIPITGDNLTEANEHFNVVLTNAVGATLARATGTATIVDDDAAPPPPPSTPTLAVSDSSFAEGSAAAPGHATFTVTLSAASATPVTVNYTTANGTATPGSDYVAQSGMLTFAAGQTQKTIQVTAIGDAAVEANEGFTVVLSNPSGATLADGTGAGTITNDDTAAPPPASSGDLHGLFAATDSWSNGFNGGVTVHNDGAATTAWQIAIDMPYQITDIWNAKILSHEGNTYIIGPAAWNGQLAHDGETSFGFVASGQLNASAVHVHSVVETPPASVPTVPTGLVATTVSSTATMLSWDAATVPGGGTVTGYAVFENGQQIATLTDTHYTVTHLTPDTNYLFSVTAIDALGSSAQANPISVHTTIPDPRGGFEAMFSPYIDMAMSQDADLVAISHDAGIANFTLAFMLSSDQGIGWQGVGAITDDTLYTPSGATTTILEQVQAIQAAGGNITISFGGAAGTEAALAAPNASVLQAEYQSVIDRYHITSIDLDIEGAAVEDQHSITMRDQAIAGLQAANPDLQVSFTLPVMPTGLVASGLNLLQSAMNDGVRVDMVNIMAMDYGQGQDNNGQMGLSAIQASEATQQQLAAMGLDAKIGITPMIGVNDIASEVFTLNDARALVAYAQSDPDVAMLSMWSVARDNGHSAGAHFASSDSSGVAQNPYEFSSILNDFDHLV
ncbi:MAG: Calx-beta domain-containing protein [Reyranella sp.]|nr:Calx-beta domain-containing protein [Reyranella sp.]